MQLFEAFLPGKPGTAQMNQVIGNSGCFLVDHPLEVGVPIQSPDRHLHASDPQRAGTGIISQPIQSSCMQMGISLLHSRLFALATTQCKWSPGGIKCQECSSAQSMSPPSGQLMLQAAQRTGLGVVHYCRKAKSATSQSGGGRAPCAE